MTGNGYQFHFTINQIIDTTLGNGTSDRSRQCWPNFCLHHAIHSTVVVFNSIEVGNSMFIRFSGQCKPQLRQLGGQACCALALLLTLLTALLWPTPGRAASPSPIVTPGSVYVEPTLWQLSTTEAAVIVTATDMQAARMAVLAVGGHVTSELWLIHGVGARVPTAR